MRSSRSSRIAIAAMLISQAGLAQETKQPEEVVVTSTALREKALDVAQPATVVSGDDLRRQIAASIGESISQELGVTATYFGPTASRPVIRGLGGERVLMLEDGISALDVSSLSGDHAVSIESVLADQVEILKGPTTLLFGSGAVGGVVNVVDGRIPSEFSKDANRAVLEVRGDTALEERSAVGRLEVGTDTVRIHVDGFTRETDDVEIPGFALSAAARAEHLEEDPDHEFERDQLHNTDSETFGGAFGFSVGDKEGFIGVSWSRFDTRYGVPEGAHEHEHEEGEEEDEEPVPVRVDMQQDRYDLKAERQMSLGPFNAIRLRGTYNDYTHQELEGAEVGTTFEQDSIDVRMNLDHGTQTGWRGTIGVQYVDIDFSALGEEAFVPPSTTEQLALFVFEKHDFDDFTIELGGRIENQQIDPEADLIAYDDTAYSLSAGIIWRFAEDHTFALNLSSSQRHPQAAELYANGPHVAIGRFEVGDAALEQETASSVDVTLHRHADTGVHWTLTAFYNDFSDFIFASDTGEVAPGLPLFLYTQADAEFYGFEGEIGFPLFERNGSRFEIRLASDYVRGTLENGGDLPQIPPLRYGLGLHYELGDLHLGLDAYRYDDQDKVAAEERPTEGYTMLDADASYRIELGATNIMVFMRGSNLLDEEARRHTSPLKEIAPLPGRSLLLGARAEF